MITLEERESIIRDAVAAVTQDSVSIDELDTVTEVTDVDSLPAYKNSDGSLVRVPIDLLAEPVQQAIEQVNQAKTQALAAAETANTASSAANRAAIEANNAADVALQASEDIIDLVGKVGDLSFRPLSEEEYEALETPEDSTLYFCFTDTE